MNHVLWLLGTLFSCGLLAIPWFILILISNPQFHCSQCGHSDSNRYLANPYLRSQEAQQNAERAALRSESSSQFSNSFTEWFSGLSSQSKRYLIYGAVTVGLLLVGIGFAVVGSRNNIRQTNTQTNSAVNKPSNVISFSPTPTPAVAVKETPKTGTTAAKQTCADIESELASVESDQARVEEMLDATEDFGPQAGSPKKAIYMNALKRKGQLQLEHIALERKLRACGKRK